jgi:hypothetical protein
VSECVAYKIDGGGFFRQHVRAFGGQHDGNCVEDR